MCPNNWKYFQGILGLKLSVNLCSGRVACCVCCVSPGQDKGMSPNITTIEDLKTMLRRIIYINSVHHAAVNYAVREFGSSVLTIPFTVFKRPEDLADLSSIVTEGNLDPLVPAFLGDYKHASVSR